MMDRHGTLLGIHTSTQHRGRTEDNANVTTVHGIYHRFLCLLVLALLNEAYLVGRDMIVLYQLALDFRIDIEVGFSYWQKASQLVYNDNKELNYKVTPRYNYIGVSALLKIYPWRRGFNIALGGRAGANLNGKGISYKSNQEDEKFAKYKFATVSETERLMKEKLTGQPDIAVGGGFGYEIGKHWNIDLRYFLGLNSTIKTERNDYNWAEHSTHGQSIELSISYLFKL